MAVRTKAQLEAAFAAIYADGQDDDSITPARIRAFWVDFAESLLDNPAILQGALDANVVTSMLRNSAVESGKIGDDAVTSAKISDGAVTGVKIADAAAARLRELLTSLAAGQRLNFNRLDGRITAAQAPANAVYTDAIANFVTAAQATNLVATWARESSPAGRVPSAQAAADSIVLIELNGNVLTIRPRTGTATTLTLPSGGSTPARTAALYSAITDTLRRPTAADFTTDATGNRAASGNIIQMEGWQGNRQLHIAIPTSENAISAIRQQGDPLAQNRLTARWFVARTDGALAIGADGSHNIYSTSRLIPSTLFAAAGSDAEPTFIIVQ